MTLRMRPRGRHGFTLVELLVVISIIALLIGMAIPAIQSAMKTARQMECSSNMKNVAMAASQYEMAQRRYPGYSNVLTLSNGKPYSDPLTGQKKGVSWVIPILAYLDQPVLDNLWKMPVGATNGVGQPMTAQTLAGSQRVELKILICAADTPAISGGTPLSYVANCGMKDGPGTPSSGSNQGMPRDWPDNGVFFDLYTGNPKVASQGSILPMVVMSSSYISRGRGVGSTIMVSENVDAGQYIDNTEAMVGMVWDGSGTVDISQDPPSLKPPDDNMRINTGVGMSDLQGGVVVQQNSQQGNAGQQSNSQLASSSGSGQSTVFARPSSFHPKGVNMAFCDGRVQLVSDSIDYYVYCLLMTTNGNRVRKPGTNNVLPNFNRALKDGWLSP